MKIHIIATAFQRPLELKRLIYDFILQTSDAWDMKIIHDGPPPDGIARFVTALKDQRIEFDYTHKINGYWGHPNRRMMLNDLKGDPNDYVLITNDDNQYVPAFVEIFLRCCTPNVGFVFCNTVHNYFDYNVLQTQVKVGCIDMGSFIVKLDVAKSVGFNNIVEVADGLYAEDCAHECKKRGLLVIPINKPLFIHN